MPARSVGYHIARERLGALVRDLDHEEVGRRVPACPAWDVHDVVAHVSGVAENLVAGELPTRGVQPWIDGIVAERQDVHVDDLLDRWAACADEVSALLDRPGGPTLLLDLIGHEHDVRAAVGRPGARGAPEVRACIPMALEQRSKAIKEAGLGALVVDSGVVRWTSHLGRPGWTMHVEPWEALRVLHSRRTADEMRAVPGSGDPEPYIRIMEERSPLPAGSLRET